MNLNITMGQYSPVDSFVHRLDPRTKILLTILMIVAVFMVHSLVGYALVLAFLYWAAKCSNVPFKMLMKGIKPLRIILILTFVLNLFFSNGTTPLIDWWIIHITREGLTQAVHYSLRLVFLVLAAFRRQRLVRRGVERHHHHGGGHGGSRHRDLADDADDLPHRALRRH